jgi:hypothetical protein
VSKHISQSAVRRKAAAIGLTEADVWEETVREFECAEGRDLHRIAALERENGELKKVIAEKDKLLEKVRNPDAALSVTIEGVEVVIRVGIERLAWCFEHGEGNTEYDEKRRDYIKQYEVIDNLQFAKDVIDAMQDEEDDGTTPFLAFLDHMYEKALDMGAQGVEESGEVANFDRDAPKGEAKKE